MTSKNRLMVDISSALGAFTRFENATPKLICEDEKHFDRVTRTVDNQKLNLFLKIGVHNGMDEKWIKQPAI